MRSRAGSSKINNGFRKKGEHRRRLLAFKILDTVRGGSDRCSEPVSRIYGRNRKCQAERGGAWREEGEEKK